ncbi:MAG: hypothetical protein HQL27_07320 [Candidatus Omnitrophica bacterium]|nr:hypothetical protein [Candidatus Omnitrophota bacterium]
MPNDSSLIIGLLVKNEQLLGALYMVFTEIFPEAKEFWGGLAHEEAGHANLLLDLEAQERKGKIRLNKNRFNIAALDNFSGYVESLIEEGKSGKYDIQNALCISLDLEDSLIEKGFFEIIDEDSLIIKHALQVLKDATIKHRDKIKDYLSRILKTRDK